MDNWIIRAILIGLILVFIISFSIFIKKLTRLLFLRKETVRIYGYIDIVQLDIKTLTINMATPILSCFVIFVLLKSNHRIELTNLSQDTQLSITTAIVILCCMIQFIHGVSEIFKTRISYDFIEIKCGKRYNREDVKCNVNEEEITIFSPKEVVIFKITKWENKWDETKEIIQTYPKKLPF